MNTRTPEITREGDWHIATLWSWDYQAAWDYQKQTIERVRETNENWLIVCSHPEVLTHGRGLQKPKKGQRLVLEDFNPADAGQLPYPLFQIERGGGLTFHHAGQLILYPIVKLNPQRLGLSALVEKLLSSVEDVLQERGLPNLDHHRDLMGLWCGPHKLASVGIAVDRMVTFHGLALNVARFDSMKAQLSTLAPCGMGFKTYTSVEEISGRPCSPADLTQEVLQRFCHAR